jgi:glyoxylase-like metal-dependent hydrolase (beta-lactamase superfamily II)
MIDAGNSPAHLSSFLEDCHRYGLIDPDYIILTHWHWDHVFGCAETTIPIICTNLTQQKLIEMHQWKWDDTSMRNRLITGEDIEFCDLNMRIEYQDCLKIKVKTADIIFNHELSINCGDITCIIKHVTNDHSPDSCVVFVPEEKVLFLGDIISPDYHHGTPHYTKEKFYPLWKELIAYDFEYAIHGHTDVFTKQLMNEFFEESIEMIKESSD